LRVGGAVGAFAAIGSIANGHLVVTDIKRSYAAAETHAVSAFAITHRGCSFDRNAFDVGFLIDLRGIKHSARGFHGRRHIGRAAELEIGIQMVESTINADSGRDIHGFVVDFSGQTHSGNAGHLSALNGTGNGLHRVIASAIVDVAAHARGDVNAIFNDAVGPVAIVIFVLIIDGIARTHRGTGVFTAALTSQRIAVDVIRVRHAAIHARIDHSGAG
jgi:hypothetical protein